MTVRRDDNGHIALEGNCGAEDAETLLQMMLATPSARVDWTRCGELHTAVVQVILAAKPNLMGACGDPWLRPWLPVAAQSSRN
jgi:hypothetical protein